MTGFPHGENRGYLRGCSCTGCRAANAAYKRAQRAKLKRVPAKQVPHGTRNGYDAYGCRCGTCTEASAAYKREYRARQQ